MSGFHWFEKDGGFRAEMPGNVTLVVTPERYAKGLTLKPARGTKWRAQASVWDGKSTLSRYGRDEYTNLQDSAHAAKKLAEDIYTSHRSRVR